MLIAILVILHPTHDATLPAQLGRANHAAALERLTQFDPKLAAALHDGDGPKPLTCSSLLDLRGLPLSGGEGRSDNITVRKDQPCAVRLTGLAPAVSTALTAALLGSPPTTWPLHGQNFTVVDAICDPQRQSWTGSVSYEELAAAQLHAGNPARNVTLEFASPTTFKSGGLQVPIPLPGLVFGSLVDRWNSFSPITLHPEVRQFAETALAISRYRLESRVVEHKGPALRVGGVGRVTYVALDADVYWLSVMQMLADFALFSGVGAQTATGMGQTRRAG